MEKVRYTLNLVIVFLMILAVAVNRDGKILGVELQKIVDINTEQQMAIETVLNDGTQIINSTEIARDISGYGGSIPLVVTFKNGILTDIEIGKNSETEEFLNTVIGSGIIEQWKGLTPTEILEHKVDAVSGATMTHNAIVGNMMRVAAYVSQRKATPTKTNIFTAKSIVGLLVILLGLYATFTRRKSQKMRMVLQVLNVAVLGLWCGSFLSLSAFVGWASNGVNIGVMFLPFALLVLSVVVPLFGKKGSYCNYHCPMGASQELVGKIVKRKMKISEPILKRLNYLREGILFVLLLVMWMGAGFSLIDYEVFSILIPQNASLFVVILGIIFLVLSAFINRPYCRFICPTGALIKISQINK